MFRRWKASKSGDDTGSKYHSSRKGASYSLGSVDSSTSHQQPHYASTSTSSSSSPPQSSTVEKLTASLGSSLSTSSSPSTSPSQKSKRPVQVAGPLKETAKQASPTHSDRVIEEQDLDELTIFQGDHEEAESGFGSVVGDDDHTAGAHHHECEPVTIRTKPATGIMSELKLTKAAPNFAGTAVVNGDFKDIQLADYRGKYLVFFFYPLDFTFVCPTELIAFSERAEEFRSIGCEVIACSTDSHFSHLAWINTPRKQGGLGNMKIPLLADKSGDVARRYGVLIEEDGIAFRGLFIIDDKGNLRQITINDLPVGRSVDEALRLVQAFQFTDKHGEVCPAGWKPGQDTMKPNVNDSKQFFTKNH